MKTFLIELDNRPDGITNQFINSYSTQATTMSMFYQRCAVATTNTTFLSVFLMVINEQGTVLDKRFIVTQYTPPEPEPEPEPEVEPEGE